MRRLNERNPSSYARTRYIAGGEARIRKYFCLVSRGVVGRRILYLAVHPRPKFSSSTAKRDIVHFVTDALILRMKRPSDKLIANWKLCIRNVDWANLTSGSFVKCVCLEMIAEHLFKVWLGSDGIRNPSWIT